MLSEGSVCSHQYQRVYNTESGRSLPNTPPQTSAGSPNGRCAHSSQSCARSHVSSGFERAPPHPVAYRVRIWLPDGSEPPDGGKWKNHKNINTTRIYLYIMWSDGQHTELGPIQKFSCCTYLTFSYTPLFLKTFEIQKPQSRTSIPWFWFKTWN